jgi:hypothetical protein
MPNVICTLTLPSLVHQHRGLGDLIGLIKRTDARASILTVPPVQKNDHHHHHHCCRCRYHCYRSDDSSQPAAPCPPSLPSSESSLPDPYSLRHCIAPARWRTCAVRARTVPPDRHVADDVGDDAAPLTMGSGATRIVRGCVASVARARRAGDGGVRGGGRGRGNGLVLLGAPVLLMPLFRFDYFVPWMGINGCSLLCKTVFGE